MLDQSVKNLILNQTYNYNREFFHEIETSISYPSMFSDICHDVKQRVFGSFF